MKKVKFTLSLALSFLLLGASLNTANAQFPKEKYSIDLTAYASDSTYIATVEASKAPKPNQQSTFPPFVVSLGTADSILSNLVTPFFQSSNGDSVNRLNDWNIVHTVTVDFPYVGGKEKIAFVSLKFITPAGTFGGVEFVESISDKSKFFSSGSGRAKYVYTFNINALFGQYPNISAIHYEVWLDDEIVNHNDDADGEGNVDGRIPRPYLITLGDGLSTDIYINGYTPSGKDFIFKVKGDAGKKLMVSTNRDTKYNDTKVVGEIKPGTGEYEIILKKVQQAINITVGYDPSTESTTGNAVIAQDAIWGAGGAVYVNAATPGVLYVYNITGQLVKQESVSGSKSFTLPKGIYIVKFNGKATKVLL
jgi:hypothetical protein